MISLCVYVHNGIEFKDKYIGLHINPQKSLSRLFFRLGVIKVAPHHTKRLRRVVFFDGLGIPTELLTYGYTDYSPCIVILPFITPKIFI